MSATQCEDESSSAGRRLYQLWTCHSSSVSSNGEKFKEFVSEFLKTYSEFIDVDFSRLTSTRLMEDGPCFGTIPQDLMHVIACQLKNCVEQLTLVWDPTVASYAEKLVCVLIVLSRDPSTSESVASNELVSKVISIAELVLQQLSSEIFGNVNQLASYLQHTFHFLECLYDPYCTWRITLKGLKVKVDRHKQKPVMLHVQVVPFFYECFERPLLDIDSQARLFHLFGAIISGSQANALKAISPATIDVLFKMIQIAAPCRRFHSQLDIMALKDLVLQCFVAIVHIISSAIPEERQVEISTVLEGYFHTMLKLCEDELDVMLLRALLDKLVSMLHCETRSSVVDSFISHGVCQNLISFLHCISTKKCDRQTLAKSVITVLTELLRESLPLKAKFEEIVGWNQLLLVLKSLGQPTIELLEALLDCVVEDQHNKEAGQLVKNGYVAVLLVNWLPDITSPELQKWLTGTLYRLCVGNSWNSLQCCQAGVNAAILTCLQHENRFDISVVGNLLNLLELTGAMSITSENLKRIIQMLQMMSDLGQNDCKWFFVWFKPRFYCRLMHVLARMARSAVKEIPKSYFDLTASGSGIATAGSLGQWSGSGFSFHAWICLDKDHASASTRRPCPLYSIMTTSGSGFEAMFNTDLVLVVAVCTKKERLTAPVNDCQIADGRWHCIDIVHMTSKRPFGQSQLVVYVDEIVRLTTQLKFPSVNEEITTCRIGCGVLHDAKDAKSVGGLQKILKADDTKDSKSTPATEAKGRWPWSKITRSATTAGSDVGQEPIPSVSVEAVASLGGQLAEVAVFTEPLVDTYVQSLYRLGPNRHLHQTEDGSLLAELPYKPLLMYHALASGNGECVDLSGNGNKGIVSGHYCSTLDVKDVIHSIGGLSVLLLLMEQAVERKTHPIDLLTSDIDSVKQIAPSDTAQMLSTCTSIETLDKEVMKNPLATFFFLLTAMVQDHQVLQDSLLRDDTIPIIGFLLQKADVVMLDQSVHNAIKRFTEVLNSSLKSQVQQYILFDFSVWRKAQFAVSSGHIQYLHTIVKDDRKYFRKKYGVQFLLDMLHKNYGSKTMSGSNAQVIRASLVDLIKFYIGREITFDELNQIVGFICAVQDEVLVCDLLDLIISLMELPGKKDQVYLLLFEPGMAELLYVLLTKREYSAELKEKILKIITLLLKTDRVYERSKSRLRLLESNLYPGLVSLMADTLPSVYMTRHMLEQVFITESAASVNASLYIIQSICYCDVTVKLEAIRQLMKILLSKPTFPKLFARQAGWQRALVTLFINQPNSNLKRQSVDINSAVIGDHQRLPSVDQKPFDSKTSNVENPVVPKPRPRLNSSSAENGNNSSVDFDCDYLDEFQAASSPPKYAFTDFLSDPYRSARRRQSSGDNVNAFSVKSLRSSSCTSNLSQVFSESGSTSPLASSCSSADWVMLRNEDSEERMSATLRTMGLTLPSMSEGSLSGDRLENIEELCQNLLIVLFTIMTRGIDSTVDDTAWQERGQVFAALNYTGSENELLMSKAELTRKLLELLLQGCIMELRDTVRSNANSVKSASQLIKLVYYFLCHEEGSDAEKYSIRLVEDILALFESLSLWQVGCDLTELEQIGLKILLSCAEHDSLELCSTASARLHTLVQTRPVEKLQESCFFVGSVENILTQSSSGAREERYNFVIPVMRALLEKCEDMLNMKALLPNMPQSRYNPSFCDDFREYLKSTEWASFMKKQVIPSKEQYQANIYENLHIQMTTFMGNCSQKMMENINKRDCEKVDGKRKFEEEIMTAFNNRKELERVRYRNVLLQLRCQNLVAQRNWNTLKSFLMGERGIWTDRNSPVSVHWKLSTQENRFRMRPKLVPNGKFDQHLEASRLRDNEDIEEDTSTEILALVKEAKIISIDGGDDRLGDDEWNLLSSSQTSAQSPTSEELTGNEKLILKEECELVTVIEVIKGRMEVTTTTVYFIDCTTYRESGETHDFKWQLSELREIHFRRYNLRRSALEFFLLDQTNFFFNFQKEARNKVYTRILSLRPPNLIYYQSRSPAELLKSSGLTQKWVNREISNFEYLMHLNTIAGRTYNDLSQYPVFPWILSNYTSEVLDLTDPSNYRDLSRPVGVVNPKNESEVREKYEHFEDPSGTIPKFHYGTHYSNPAGVMHYLIRMEPFTSLHIQLQGGRFDVADRQFHSIPAMWQGLMENPNDVKELIPEFFYLPEFLENSNDFDLGRLQILEEKVDNVILPPWATSAYDFIHKHMKALESDHVSAHLHEWIDLIFGYKQQGQAAVDALNVFYYCTYEGAVDLDSITDASKRKALEGMINNFGQTPCQLLKEPHPQRMTTEEALSKLPRLDRSVSLFSYPTNLKTFHVEAALPNDPLVFTCVPRTQIRSFMQHGASDAMIAITHEGVLGVHGWLSYNKSITNFFTFERDTLLNNAKTRRRLLAVGSAWSPAVDVTPRLFAVTPDAKLVYFGGNWDNSIRVYSIARSRQTAYAIQHTDVVTCVSLDFCGRRLISGSRDKTCIIWDVTSQAGINPKPLHVLHGHDTEITCIAIATELDIAVSGSKDGLVLVHTVRQGIYIRTLRPPFMKGWQISVQQLAMSDTGQLCVYCQHVQKVNASPSTGKGGVVKDFTLHLYSVNGKHMSRDNISDPVVDMVVSGGYLVYGDVKGELVIKELFGLRSLTSISLEAPVTCVALTNGAGHIFAGLSNSKLIIVALHRPSELKS